MFQITAELPFALDLAFVSGLEADTDAERQHTESGKRAEGLTGSALNGLLQQHEAAFDSRFKRTFGSFSAPGTPAGTAEVAKAALSNLLGSIGYFYGSSLIALPPDRSGKPGQQSVVPSWDAPLFTAVPSRSFFPRGFLWDEGFHQLLVRKWDRRLSRDILAHWLDLMNSHGWIAREQILGAEARSRVPADFVVQRPDSANPPTLFLPLSDMASEVAADMAAELDPDPKRAAEVPGKGLRASPAEQAAEAEFLLQAFPRLQAWFGWFNATQAGPVAHSYRWRGRDASTVRELNPKTLTSGLDDYPRASHPTKEERHVDLRCWMALAASSLVSIGTHMGLPAHQVAPYQETVALLGDVASLNALHYDASRGQYLDYGYHTEDVSLKWMLQRAPDGGVVARELRRMVGAPPKLQFVPHFGYVSLFPLLMGLLDKDSPELGQQLEHLRNPELLWTPYGLRSLSATSSMHGKYNTEHDAPYWRGPIWMNLNFLTLRALHRYGQAGGKHAARAGQIYAELRSNVLRNMVEAYAQSGYLWENYDQADGHGKGSHPFTGWTALLVLIGAESY
ncbi:hypothetical protein WJX72_005454 [[Myrmecia] bisecta]|uniref:mannosyl-oligosaccharide glucosidase n=1 Tax=[Myrmecia] bisecta TaxID=41462 RepID=A0AAW1QQN0_9CHLO